MFQEGRWRMNHNRFLNSCLLALQFLLLFFLLSPFPSAEAGRNESIAEFLADPAALSPGLKIRVKPFTWRGQALYSYIDGGADFFLNHGFVVLTGAVFGLSGSSESLISVDVYDMGKKENALKVFSLKKGKNSLCLNIGDASYGNKDFILFYSGRYYVEIQSVALQEHGREAVPRLAKKLALYLASKKP